MFNRTTIFLAVTAALENFHLILLLAVRLCKKDVTKSINSTGFKEREREKKNVSKT